VTGERVGNPKPFGVPGREHGHLNDLSRVLDLNLVHMRQVHETKIEVVTQPLDDPPICDGLATDREGLGLVVRTADCVPLLMWDEKQNVVAAVHAGWRGTLAEVVPRAVNSLEERFGSRPDTIHVAMGPSIGPCCYEVGDEVVGAFAERFTGWENWFVSRSGQRKHLDLIEANRRQLTDSGVRSEQVYAARLCTCCNNELFYSYRKEGKGVGRLMGIVGVARI
jgi:YfiH family protein